MRDSAISNRDIARQSLRRVEETAPAIPLACARVAPPELWMPEDQKGLDDRTLGYILAARPAFDLLRDASSQLAALLILSAAGGRSAQDNPVFALACEAQAKAQEIIRSLRPGLQGAHHHRHLLACARAMGAACRHAAHSLHKKNDEAALTMLREGLRQLHFAAGALPGFEVVAFSQSCCAAHSFAGKASREMHNG